MDKEGVGIASPSPVRMNLTRQEVMIARIESERRLKYRGYLGGKTQWQRGMTGDRDFGLAGKFQSSLAPIYYPACRWRPENLKRDIGLLHRQLVLHRTKITCRDFGEVLRQLDHRAFVYLDPPYYEKGGQLYKHNMDDADHERLAGILKTARFSWVLSYDDHPRIRRLYDWATIASIHVTYTTATAKTETRPKNHEILITPS